MVEPSRSRICRASRSLKPGRTRCATRPSTSTSASSAIVKLLLNGAFSPLEGFLGQQDYERVLADMRLADGTLWPIPVTLDVASELADALEVGARPRPARSGRLRGRGAARELDLAAGQAARGAGGVRHHRRQPSRRRRICCTTPSRAMSAARCRALRGRSSMISSSCAMIRKIYARNSHAGDGRGSSPSRPGTRCIARIRS